MLNDCMDARPAIEEGFRALFTALGINAFTRRNAPEDFQTTRPRVEIHAKIGAATGHKFVSTATTTATGGQPGVLFNDTWNFEIVLRCVTEPQNTEGDNQLNDLFVSQIRGMAQTFGQSTWTDTADFPNHLIVEPLKDTTTNDNLQSDDNDEYSDLSFSGIVQVRTASWNN